MRGFSMSGDFFLLGGINFFGSLILLLLFSLIPMSLWEPLNSVWQFLFLFFFLGILFDMVPAFFTTLRRKCPDITVVCEAFGWIPYVYIAAFTTLAGLDIFGQFRLQFSPLGMWLTVIVPVVISLGILYMSTKKGVFVITTDAVNGKSVGRAKAATVTAKVVGTCKTSSVNAKNLTTVKAEHAVKLKAKLKPVAKAAVKAVPVKTTLKKAVAAKKVAVNKTAVKKNVEKRDAKPVVVKKIAVKKIAVKKKK